MLNLLLLCFFAFLIECYAILKKPPISLRRKGSCEHFVCSALFCRDRQDDECSLAIGIVEYDVVGVGHASELEVRGNAESFLIDHHGPGTAVEADWSRLIGYTQGQDFCVCVPSSADDFTVLLRIPEHCTSHLQGAVLGSENELRQDGSRTFMQRL